MDKSKIPPIKIEAAFYAVKKDKAVDWLGDLQLYSYFDLKEMKTKQKGEILQIIKDLYENEKHRQLVHEKIINNFSKHCGIGPSKVEEILECTKTERKMWEEEKKLPVVDHFNAGSNKNPVWVPMYCRRTIESLEEDIIKRWRADHQAALSLSRKTHEKVKLISKNVILKAYKVNEKIYTIMGPVLIPEDEIEKFWEKNKGKTPIEWNEGRCVIVLQEYNTENVLRIGVVEEAIKIK